MSLITAEPNLLLKYNFIFIYLLLYLFKSMCSFMIKVDEPLTRNANFPLI